MFVSVLRKYTELEPFGSTWKIPLGAGRSEEAVAALVEHDGPDLADLGRVAKTSALFCESLKIFPPGIAEA